MEKEKAIEILKESNAFLEGHFLLSSGMHSPAYVQCAQLLQHPGRAGLICAALADLWKEELPDVVVGPAMGGILVAYETARSLGARALFTFVMTMGSRAPDAQWISSCIRASPCDEVAVKVRAPADDAPIRLARAECSDSTFMNVAFRVPSPHISERSSTIWVCGVMG